MENNIEVFAITLTETLFIPNIVKSESNNCFIRLCFEEDNEKQTMFKKQINQSFSYILHCVNSTLLLEIMHCMHGLQIIHLNLLADN